MKDHQSADTPIWPYVSVVACLFFLSILAAESWQTPSRVTRRYQSRASLSQTEAVTAADGVLARRTSADGFASKALPQEAAQSFEHAGPSAQTASDIRSAGIAAHGSRPAVSEESDSLEISGPATSSGHETDSWSGVPFLTDATGQLVTVPQSGDQGTDERSQEVDPARTDRALSVAESRPPEIASREGVAGGQKSFSSDAEVHSSTLDESPSDGPSETALDRSSTSLAEIAPSAESVVEKLQTPELRSAFAPPVAEQIQLDVSVAKQPALPHDPPRQEAVSPSQPLVPSPFKLPPSSATEPQVSAVVSAWPRPTALLEMLEALESRPDTRHWAEEALLVVQQLGDSRELASESVSRHLRRIDQLAAAARRHSSMVGEHQLRVDLLRAAYALERRGQIWEKVHWVSSSPNGGLVSVGFEDLDPVLAEVEQTLAGHEVGRGWRNYLKLDTLHTANRRGDLETQRALARHVLLRMESEQWLDETQREFLQTEPFLRLAQALRRWAREPVDLIELLDEIEAYEDQRGGGAAAALADIYQQARWSDQRLVAELAETLNKHYRNANLRVAPTRELINRLLPQPEIVEEEIDENLLGAQVWGTSRTDSRLNVTLQPDAELWRIGLEATGNVKSETSASKGPATFYNEGHSEFRANKTLLVDRHGVKVFSAEAVADSETALRGFETEYDPVPVLGLLARAIARQQHNGRVSDVQREAESRLEQRAQARLDEEVQRRLTEIEDDFRVRVLNPLKQLRLHPTALDMQTTEERLVIRYRIAGDQQLGAHTPRPQAPSDSLLSVQFHETVLNNTIEQLRLSKEAMDLRQMYRSLADQFRRSDLEVPEDIPENVQLRFAARDPVRVRFDDERAVLTMRIAELKSDRNRWRNFAVRAYYVPDSSQLQANLVRDGVIELAGQRLRFADQLALRGIFSKVFSRNRPVNIVNKRLARHPRMSDLQVTQFVISDGWIGVALGPQRGGSLQHVAREPQRHVR